MKEIFIKNVATHILYDNATSFEPLWFDSYELKKRGWLTGTSIAGRAPAYFFQPDNNAEYCLKQYYRGGLFKYLTNDKYIYMGKRRIRSFKELEILNDLHNQGLPVPVPVAASFSRDGAAYRAFLITSSCRPALPLSEVLTNHQLDTDAWVLLGGILKRLHEAKVYHADLNAYNILYNAIENQFWIIDFDRAYKAESKLSQRMRQRNLNRLQKSLERLSSDASYPFRYSSRDFDYLVQGYAS